MQIHCDNHLGCEKQKKNNLMTCYLKTKFKTKKIHISIQQYSCSLLTPRDQGILRIIRYDIIYIVYSCLGTLILITS